MVKYENRCIGCTEIGLMCLGESCRYRHVPVHFCDKCGIELEGDIYEADGEELCEDCLKSKYLKYEA